MGLNIGVLEACSPALDTPNGDDSTMPFKKPCSPVNSLETIPAITLPAPANRSSLGKELPKPLRIINFLVLPATLLPKMETLESQKLPMLKSMEGFAQPVFVRHLITVDVA